MYVNYRIFEEAQMTKEKKLPIVPLPRDNVITPYCISYLSFSTLHFLPVLFNSTYQKLRYYITIAYQISLLSNEKFC